MKDFAAIDFETANSQRSSVCSVGVVVVRGGEISEQIYRLIRPEPEYYSYFNTLVHGLTELDTKSAPIFPQVWREISPHFDGLALVAHNAPFDQSCLKSVFASYSMDYPEYEFYCTCRAARAKFKNLPAQLRPPNAKLDTVARFCGFEMQNHHNAVADALACAQIALKLLA